MQTQIFIKLVLRNATLRIKEPITSSDSQISNNELSALDSSGSFS
ncbi:129_t:CDS:2 [Ambispora gerdemannii]|uniref:129_t:CDS:1 n=1 Tax=Ambispora gerdemannii TaxID=144530 RepID=A0A9N8WFP7_9GLOM|nr:129_t:CDS:2 [Ambispora gerdemannii]